MTTKHGTRREITAFRIPLERFRQKNLSEMWLIDLLLNTIQSSDVATGL